MTKNKSKELDVDFIGEQNKPMTQEELFSISVFLKQLKQKRNTTAKRKIPKLEKQFA
ncbi:MAG: hypothetical protein LBE36_02500 [Flavobacteriaceae bacterium]|jgi:hypothetical protein|nr:hypothetical protein [Flavobacteriaceae bacterium]